MKVKNILHDLPSSILVQQALIKHKVIPTKTGALILYTGRSPNDKYIVDTSKIHEKINWGKNNQLISKESFKSIYQKTIKFFSSQKQIYLINILFRNLKKYSKKLKNTKPYFKKIINSYPLL